MEKRQLTLSQGMVKTFLLDFCRNSPEAAGVKKVTSENAASEPVIGQLSPILFSYRRPLKIANLYLKACAIL